jgi:ABC-type nitrate/sulfonate/bicarbonate transport system substrate-binding protein
MNAIANFFVATCVALLVAATGSAGAAAKRTRALTPVTVAVLPIEPTGPGVLAKDEGFFRRQGLEVTVVVVTEPAQTAASVLSGDAQFSSVSVGALALLKLRNLPIRVVAGGSLHVPKALTSALVAAPGQRITSARDLVGKHIGLDAENQLAHIGSRGSTRTPSSA